ncbi:MAG: S8 family serine peptidase [Bdellovibrionales bacterium]
MKGSVFSSISLQRIQSTMEILIVSVVVVIFFQNCSGFVKSEIVNKESLDPDGSRYCRVEKIGLSDFANTPADITQSLKNAISSNGGSAQGVDLLVIVDNRCLRSRSDRSLLTENVSPIILQAIEKYSATSVTPDEPLSLSELQSIANNDLCVEMVDLEIEMQLFACENCGTTPNDQHYGLQQHLNSIKHQQTLSRYFNPNNGIDTEDPIVRVGVIDTGIDYFHADLIDRASYDIFSQPLGLDPVNPGNNIRDNHDPGHGTHVAGLIGATANNGIGVSGVMGHSLELIPMNVKLEANPNDGKVSMAAVITSLLWASETGMDVINMSIGGGAADYIESLRVAMQTAVDSGIFLLSAAGNNGLELGVSVVNYPTGPAPLMQYPAMHSAEIEGAITVGASNATTMNRSSFSNYNPSYVDLMSPGSEVSGGNNERGIVSTLSNLSGGDYGYLAGTSMATLWQQVPPR